MLLQVGWYKCFTAADLLNIFCWKKWKINPDAALSVFLHQGLRRAVVSVSVAWLTSAAGGECCTQGAWSVLCFLVIAFSKNTSKKIKTLTVRNYFQMYACYLTHWRMIWLSLKWCWCASAVTYCVVSALQHKGFKGLWEFQLWFQRFFIVFENTVGQLACFTRSLENDQVWSSPHQPYGSISKVKQPLNKLNLKLSADAHHCVRWFLRDVCLRLNLCQF